MSPGPPTESAASDWAHIGYVDYRCVRCIVIDSGLQEHPLR